MHSLNNEGVVNYLCNTSGCASFVEDGDNRDTCCKNICRQYKWGQLRNKSIEFIVDGGHDRECC